MNIEINSYGIIYNADTFSTTEIHLILKGNPKVVIIKFEKPGVNASKSAVVGDKIYIYYMESKLSAIVDILRNEKPLFFNYNESSGAAYIYCTMEPVGAGE